MLSRRFLVATIALLSAATAASAADDSPQPIKLSRSVLPGDSYTVHATLDSLNKMSSTSFGQLPAISQLPVSGEFSGRIDVKSTDKAGIEKEFSLTIARFVGADPKQPILVPGRVVDIKRDTKTITFTLRDGGKINQDALEILGLVYMPLNAADATPDDAFGSPAPHKAGDSWAVNAAAAASRIASDDTVIDPKTLTGTTTLKAVDTTSGQPILHLVTAVAATSFKPKAFPPELAVQTSDFKSEIVQSLPVDESKQPLEYTQTTDFHFACIGTGDATVKMDVVSHNMVKMEFSPAK